MTITSPHRHPPSCLPPASPITLSIGVLAIAMSAHAGITLPDWTEATFGPRSTRSENPFFPLDPGDFRVYEGVVEDGAIERIETFVTFDTVEILGVQNRVVRDSSFVDGVLVEVALDWYAQADDGTVWYFGEYVENFTYDEDGVLIKVDNNGSWIADGVINLPGAIMLSDPQVGDEYFQEYAPSVALDFALVTSVDDTVTIGLGVFKGVLNTSEGNLFDGPSLAENKLYAPKIGLVKIEVLDDEGETEFTVELIETPQRACLGDLDYTNQIDGADLGALLGAWGRDDEFADLDLNGIVDGVDVGLLLAAWGECPSSGGSGGSGGSD